MTASIQVASEGRGSLAEQMGRWLDRVLGPEYHAYRARDAWNPSINLYEDGEAFYLVADLAGVVGDEIDLRVERGRLVLQGKRASPRPRECQGECSRDPSHGPLRVHLMEIDDGPFLRTVDLPASVDAERIEACYRNGLLWVKMAKRS